MSRTDSQSAGNTTPQQSPKRRQVGLPAPHALRPRKRRATPGPDAQHGKTQASATEADPAQSHKSRSWRQDLSDVQKAAFWVWLAIIWLPSLSLSTLSVGDVFATAWRAIQSGSISPAETAQVWKMFVLTAPFTTAVAIVGVAVLRGWFEGDSFACLYFGAFVLMAMTLAAKGLSIGAAVELEEYCTVNLPPASWIINLMASYCKVYTLGMFASSLTIGCFAAWAWSTKILPRLERLRP